MRRFDREPGLRVRLRGGLPAVLLALLLPLAAVAPGVAEPSDYGLGVVAADAGPRANPPLPSTTLFPVQLVLDDDAAESVFGFTGGTARQFLWLNRFANVPVFELAEIWVLFPAGTDVPLGGAVQLAVFLDPDGDPANGANLLATYDQTIQAIDGNTFSVYSLSPPLVIGGSGDLLVAVVNRYFTTGVDPPPTLPAALDTTASQDRSYFALWSGDPPDPPDLASAQVVDVLDGLVAGNFMIRAFGRGLPPTAVPAVRIEGIVVMVLLLAAVAVLRLRFL